MKITDRQICEDQIVTLKQSHILMYQGLLFLTQSTCVIVDARSHTSKSHDFIPRYDINDLGNFQGGGGGGGSGIHMCLRQTLQG